MPPLTPAQCPCGWCGTELIHKDKDEKLRKDRVIFCSEVHLKEWDTTLRRNPVLADRVALPDKKRDHVDCVGWDSLRLARQRLA